MQINGELAPVMRRKQKRPGLPEADRVGILDVRLPLERITPLIGHLQYNKSK
jgi:hypothetical protein